MRRELRLRKTADFERVRRSGTSYAHPLMILIKLSNEMDHSRFGFSASRTVGNAVKRNRARRMLREAVRLQADAIAPGWDVVLLARKSLATEDFQKVRETLKQLLQRAALLSAHPDL